MKQNRKTRMMTIIGFALVFVVLMLFFMSTSAFQQKEEVVVANAPLVPFVRANDQVTFKKVPKKSVEDTDLTRAEYQSNFLDKKKPLIPVIDFLPGQRIDERALTGDAASSFSAVLPDERVVSVTATLAASVLGTPRPGDVVDISVRGNQEGSIATFAKLICISAKPNGCKDVVPNSVVGADLAGDKGAIYMLLAVAKAEALNVAGQDVIVSLNPFCRVGDYGRFVSVRRDNPCEAPQGRLASSPVSEAEKQAVEPPSALEQPTTTTGASTTTGTTTATTMTSTTPAQGTSTPVTTNKKK